MIAAILVPVVWVDGVSPSEPQVLFRPAVSEPVRPALAYRSDVEDVGKLCMAVQAGLDANRGEWPDEAYVLATNEFSARTKPLQGRSCALAMALASLSRYYHLPVQQATVATGNLDGSGNVLPVKHLLTKLQACARDGHAGDLVLFPACQMPGGSAADQLSATVYAELVSRLPHLVPVATLAEAANLALQPPVAFGESLAARLRSEIEHLRYDRSRAGELYARSRELFELARPLPDERGLGPILRYHALMTGEFALRALVQDSAELRHWPGVQAASTADLQVQLLDRAEAIFAKHQDWLPAELRAEHANFHAVRGFQTLDFLSAIHKADHALSLPKLVVGQHSERRKLIGTRAQFRWRQGLRMLATGSRRDAEHWLSGAVQDAREALDHAPKGAGATEGNDAARVRVYVCHALLALRTLRPWTGPELDEFDRQTHHVLGQILSDNPQSEPPSQHPGWMLDAVLQRLALEGNLTGALTLWDRAAALEYSLPATGSPAPTRLARILDPGPPLAPCDASVLQTLLAVAVDLGQPERAAQFAHRLAIHHAEPSLPALVRLWPATFAPPHWTLPLPAWLARWRDGVAVDLKLPEWVEQEPFVADQLAALRRPADSRAAQRRLQLWLGVAA